MGCHRTAPQPHHSGCPRHTNETAGKTGKADRSCTRTRHRFGWDAGSHDQRRARIGSGDFGRERARYWAGECAGREKDRISAALVVIAIDVMESKGKMLMICSQGFRSTFEHFTGIEARRLSIYSSRDCGMVKEMRSFSPQCRCVDG